MKTNEQIKQEADKFYLQIKIAEEKLRLLRLECGHQETFKGNYSWRPDSTLEADICKYCGEVIKTYLE